MAKMIYSPDSLLQADTLRDLLQTNGIESALVNENPSQWQETSITTPMMIAVHEKDAERATAVIQEYCDQLTKLPPSEAQGRLASQENHRLRMFYLSFFGFICLIAAIDSKAWMLYAGTGIGFFLIVVLLAVKRSRS